MKTSITDNPRKAKEKDDFGIEPFENGLKRFIENTSTPITIALQGEWGSGKTSLMNSLNEKLSSTSTSEYYSVWLNTWEFALMKDAQSTLISIITQLIKETTKIAQTENSKAEKLLFKVANIGKSVFKSFAKAGLKTIADGSEEIVDNLLPDEDSSVGEIRNELESIITNYTEKNKKKGFIFFIDDLDRIDPPVAVELLELLKNIFTLRDCVFVLAIDYDVVVKGLEPKFGKLTAENEREFRSFFDKIIQVPFSMPVTSYKVNNFLSESLLKIGYIEKLQSTNNKLISDFSEIANLTVGSNPRAIKRLLNSLSLIKCINDAKPQANNEDDRLNGELDLLINFALVSIQIAYPRIYNLLSQNNDFTAWNDTIALKMNLKELDAVSKEKLNKLEEFNDEWEQILFRICETDYFLKQKALNISTLLNKLKSLITSKNEDNIVEDYINRIISMSSITNLVANEKPAHNFHPPTLLKNVRAKLIPILKQKLPAISNSITLVGSRVQVNAQIELKKGVSGITLTSSPFEGKIKLIIKAAPYFCSIKYGTIQKQYEKFGCLGELEQLEKEYNLFAENFIDNNSILGASKLLGSPINYQTEIYAGIHLYVLGNESDFEDNKILDKIGEGIKGIYEFNLKINQLRERLNNAIKEAVN